MIYTPSTTSDAIRTPTASVASALPTTSTSLNAVFNRLGIEDQRKALRSLQNVVLGEALGCTQKEVATLIVTSSGDELWAAFCQLNIENRKRSLESVRKFALRKAFEEESGEGDYSVNIASYSVSVAHSEPSTNALASAFKKLSVEKQEKAFGAVQTNGTPKKGLRRGADGWDHDEIGGGDDGEDTLIDNKPDLAAWQELCRACGVEVEDIPGSITKCKEVHPSFRSISIPLLILQQVLKTKNVALSDLSEAIEQGTVAQTFPSLNQLRKHVTSHNKVANKAATKENRFLKKMLRELFRYRTPRAGASD